LITKDVLKLFFLKKPFAVHGHTDCLQILLSNGGDINQTEKEGLNSITLAACMNP